MHDFPPVPQFVHTASNPKLLNTTQHSPAQNSHSNPLPHPTPNPLSTHLALLLVRVQDLAQEVVAHLLHQHVSCNAPLLQAGRAGGWSAAQVQLVGRLGVAPVTNIPTRQGSGACMLGRRMGCTWPQPRSIANCLLLVCVEQGMITHTPQHALIG